MRTWERGSRQPWELRVRGQWPKVSAALPDLSDLKQRLWCESDRARAKLVARAGLSPGLHTEHLFPRTGLGRRVEEYLKTQAWEPASPWFESQLCHLPPLTSGIFLSLSFLLCKMLLVNTPSSHDWVRMTCRQKVSTWQMLTAKYREVLLSPFLFT